MNHRTLVTAAAALAAAVSCAGCIMPDQFSQVQKDLVDVRQRIQQIESEQAAARARLQEVADLAQRGAAQDDQEARQDLADLGFRMDQATREAAQTDQRLRELSQRFERLSQELDRREREIGASAATPLAEGGSTRTAGGSAAAPTDAEDLYNTAYADFSKGNYDLAIAGFLEFQRTYPESSQADNALYWVGECNFSQGDFSAAIEAFDRLLETFPDSDKAASGDLKKGLAYLEQNQVGKAIVQFQHVHDRYAGTDEARVARDRLSALGVQI